MSQDIIKIVTDSTCDIPQAQIDQYDISVLPQLIVWGDQQFRDRVDITPEEFYTRLVADPMYPTTAQVSIEQFVSTFIEAKTKGAKEIIMLTVSSAMSGTYRAAQYAASLVDIPVHVVDAKGPTMSLGWQVLAAARMRDLGGCATEILKKVDDVRKSLVQFVAMDSIEYLYKGGRIGNATRFLGSMLHIKPLVYINHESGLVEPSGVARTHKKLVDMMYERFFERLDITKTIRIAVLHGNVLGEAQELAERIIKEFSPAEILINITGPVLGVNTGPGALALCGYSED